MELENIQVIVLFGVVYGFTFFGIIHSRVLGSVVLFASLLLVRIYFEPVYFPDYIGYFYYHLGLTYNGVGFYGSFEILSKILFVYGGKLLPSIDSLTAVHWVVFCISFSLLLLGFFQKKHDQLAFLAMLAIAGPIVLMVTMRASIAYALIALFILKGVRFRSWDVLLLVITPAIHVSVLLVIAPLLMYQFVRQARISQQIVFLWTLVFIVIGSVLKLASFKLPIYAIMLSIATGVIPNLAKYEVYVSDQTSVFHHVYYLLITVIVVLFYRHRKQIYIDARLLLIMSWVFFMLGPVAVVAFRYSLFFVIPLIMTASTPAKINGSLPLRFVVAASCAGFFILHLLSLYDVYF